jgi:mutator protein MutT
MRQSPTRVVAAVIRAGPHILACQRPPQKRHGGLWEFPGGKCEPFESDDDAVRRELHEELAVTVTNVGSELFAIADPGSDFLIVFLPVEISGAPQCLEHEAIVWGTAMELAALPLAPSDRRFIEFLRASE